MLSLKLYSHSFILHLLRIQAINSYFQAIVDEVTSHGGDILKFAGDAIFAEWRAEDNEKMSHNISRQELLSPSEKLNLTNCVHTAAVCGAAIVNKCADYPIFAESITGGQGPQVATLNVHCGLGVGEMAGVHVGNEYSRREYLILGEPIDQVSEACDSAKLGELRASAAAISHLNKGQLFEDQLKIKKDAKSAIIASRRQVFFNKKRKATWSMNGRVRKPTKANMKDTYTIPFDQMDLTSLKYFHKILSFYVHPVVVSDELAQMLNPNTRRDGQMAQERHRAEAELRSVFTIFIKPKIDANLSDDPAKNDKTFKQLNDVMNAVTSVVDSFRGHLRQYIVDDKGTFMKCCRWCSNVGHNSSCFSLYLNIRHYYCFYYCFY